MFTDSATPEWFGADQAEPRDFDDMEWDQEASTQASDFDFDQMVELTLKFSLASTQNKRKAFYTPCDKCGDGPVSFENGGKTSHNWCGCEI